MEKGDILMITNNGTTPPETPVVLEVKEIPLPILANQVGHMLREGKLAIIPTDTVYGLAIHPHQPNAEERLFEAKKRDRNKPIALLATSKDEVRMYGGHLTAEDEALATKYWPGPLTLVLPVHHPIKQHNMEGFRVPSDPLTLAILRAAGGILRVTSANVSGNPPALTAHASLNALSPFVDIVVNAGTICGGVPSTVAQVSNHEATILREGAISAHEIKSCINKYKALCQKEKE